MWHARTFDERGRRASKVECSASRHHFEHRFDRITHGEPRKDQNWTPPSESRDNPFNVRSYKLQPAGDGTNVIESFQPTQLPALRLYRASWAGGRRNREDMRRTLERITAKVESTAY